MIIVIKTTTIIIYMIIILKIIIIMATATTGNITVCLNTLAKLRSARGASRHLVSCERNVDLESM